MGIQSVLPKYSEYTLFVFDMESLFPCIFFIDDIFSLKLIQKSNLTYVQQIKDMHKKYKIQWRIQDMNTGGAELNIKKLI